jgi:cell wall-associated NlpC family hydrolase
MAKIEGISGTAIAVVLGGSILAYAGLKGQKIGNVARSLIAGKAPTGATDPTLAVTSSDPIGSLPPGHTTSASSAVDSAIAFARAQIGKPYVWGATGPNGFDCSGLIQAAYKYAGVSLPRTTFQQIFSGREVSKADLIAGDLIFPDAGHVQIYVGDGQVIESPQAGENVRQTAVWGFWRARRVA